MCQALWKIVVSLIVGLWTCSLQAERIESVRGIYEDVRIRQVTPEAVIFFYEGNIMKVPLRELSQEDQVRFGYDPKEAAAHREKLEAQALEARKQARALRERQVARKDSLPEKTRAELALQQFGSPPVIQKTVDFRPELKAFELFTKNQGIRPSCSVFSILSAFEYQKALAEGEAEPLSEEYLIWATRQMLGMNESKRRQESSDLGFTLSEVAQALQTYGVPLEEEVPYAFKGELAAEAPPQAVQEAAQSRLGNIQVFRVLGRDNVALLDNVFHALNMGVPVAIGLAWPESKTLWKAPYLKDQQPEANTYHAVTLVGYSTKTGRKEDVVFVFKNSYGPRWGASGYGYVSYSYLMQHLRTAIILSYR